MTNLDLPDVDEDWPHDAKKLALAERNDTTELRKEIDALVGFKSQDYDTRPAGQFYKHELAEIIYALGGPQ